MNDVNHFAVLSALCNTNQVFLTLTISTLGIVIHDEIEEVLVEEGEERDEEPDQIFFI